MRIGNDVFTFDGHRGTIVPGTVAGSGDFLVKCADGLIRLYGPSDLRYFESTHCPFCRVDTSSGEPVFVHPELGYRYCTREHAEQHNGVAEFYGVHGDPDRGKWRAEDVPEDMVGLVTPWSEYVPEPPKICRNAGCNEETDGEEYCGNDCEIDHLTDTLDSIHRLYDGTTWDSATTSATAEILAQAGYTIREPEED